MTETMEVGHRIAPPIICRWAFSLDPEGKVRFSVVSAPPWPARILGRLLLGIHWRRIP